LEVTGIVVRGVLELEWRYGTKRQARATMERVAAHYAAVLRALLVHRGAVAHSAIPAPATVQRHAPVGLAEPELSDRELDELLADLPEGGRIT
jgi:hypothetical protein